MGQTSQNSDSHLWRLFVWLTYLFLILRTAWVSDDAYITARVIENFINGYGPVYNIGERVQVYTHPLWFLLLSSLYGLLVHGFNMDFRSQMYFFLIGVSLATSALAMLVVLYKAWRSSHIYWIGVLVLFLSRAFIDFSTSGLEYPLLYLLLALWMWRWHQAQHARRTAELSALFALLLLTRMDAGLLLLPLWLWEILPKLLRDTRRTLVQILAGLSPFVLWMFFSLVYYGFVFPNTYYAKLGGTGIFWRFRVTQGIIYILDSWDADPLTPFVILVAAATGLVVGRTVENRERVLLWGGVAGIGLAMAYVLYVGGDFMRGRFLVPIFFWSVLLWDRIPWPQRYLWPTLGVLALLGFSGYYPVFNPQRLLMVPDGVRNRIWGWDRQGISDERLYYMETKRLGLVQWYRVRYPKTPFPSSTWQGRGWRFQPERYRVMFAITAGVVGYEAGPNVHIVDAVGIVDPLLARLPAVDKETWRPGHIFRVVPKGYLKALETGDIEDITDPEIRAYYRALSLVVRGPLFSVERWRAIWALNTGRIRPPHQYLQADEQEINRYLKRR